MRMSLYIGLFSRQTMVRSETVLRLSYILPQLEGMSGTLHLESWTENTTDISFKKNEQ